MPYVMSEFGPRGDRFHHGIDIQAEEGHPVASVADGVVTHATENGARGFSDYGRTVVVRHDDGAHWSLYSHLLRNAVNPGQRVRRGDLLGYVGRTRGRYEGGRSIPDLFHTSPPHLHFEVRTRKLPAPPGEGALDPQKWLAARGLPLPTDPQLSPVSSSPWVATTPQFHEVPAAAPAPAPGAAPVPTPAPMRRASMAPLGVVVAILALGAAIARRRG